jgi:transcriptional regulator with XRE-family HTH domain
MARKRVVGPRSARLGALGDAIAEARQGAGMSQETLGSLSGVHPVHVRGLERGVQNPTYNTLLKVAGSLEMTVGELTMRADELYRSRAGASEARPI